MKNKIKIYTKTGDKGETGYLGGRISKTSKTINLLGGLDELNSYLGVCHTFTEDENLQGLFLTLQSRLFSVGAVVADKDSKMKLTAPVQDWIADLETKIDEIQAKLPELKNFILPGGSSLASHVHHARSICRRIERDSVAYSDTSDDARLKEIAKYLNRLSDFLFVLARKVNQDEGVEELIWRSN